MSTKIKIIVKGDVDEANVAKEKLKLKGYDVTLNQYTQAVVDGTALGGHFDYLQDSDDEVFVVIGAK